MVTEMDKKGTNGLTLADIDHESSRNGWDVNPIAGRVLNLKPNVGRDLEQL